MKLNTLHENDTQFTERIVDPNSQHQFATCSLFHRLYPLTGSMSAIWYQVHRNSDSTYGGRSETWGSAQKYADRLRRGENRGD